MALRKQTVTLNDATTKRKVVNTVRDMVPLHPLINHIPTRNRLLTSEGSRQYPTTTAARREAPLDACQHERANKGIINPV